MNGHGYSSHARFQFLVPGRGGGCTFFYESSRLFEHFEILIAHVTNAGAKAVMAEFPDIVIAIGESDEFSFVFKRSSAAYKRRTRFANVLSGGYGLK